MIDVDVKADTQGVEHLLTEVKAKAKQKMPYLMRVCGLVMKREVERNFEAGGRPGKWTPLSPSTVAKRTKEGHWPGKILIEHGQLVASITMQATSTQAIVGTNKVYAPILHFGGTIHHPATSKVTHFKVYKHGKHKGKALFSKARGATYGQKIQHGAHNTKIPPRPFMVLTPEGIDEMEQKAQAALWAGQKEVSK